MNLRARKRHRWMMVLTAVAAAVALMLAWSSHRPHGVMDELPPALEETP